MRRTAILIALMATPFLRLTSQQAVAFDIQGGDTIDRPLDLRFFNEYERDSFIALCYLRTFVKNGVWEEPTNEGPIAYQKVRADICSEHLMRQFYPSRGEDVFQRKRSQEAFKNLIVDPNGIASRAASVRYVAMDVTDWVDKNYDFSVSAFPIIRDDTTTYITRTVTSNRSWGPGSQFYIVPFNTKSFPISADLAEKWIKSRGGMIAVCELGKLTPARTQGTNLSFRSKCLRLMLVDSDGHILAEAKDIKQSKFFDIHKDF